MKNKNTSLIGVASGWGAQVRATEHGPDAMKHFGLCEKLRQENYTISWQETIYPFLRFANDKDIPPEQCIPYVKDICESVFHAVLKSLSDNRFPCVIGGDHSIAIGTWSALASTGEMGLIWFDAHMDAHTPKTSPSFAYHGMPIACLLGEGSPSLIQIGNGIPKLKPENVVLIGVRSYEPGELHFLSDKGVKVFYMRDVKEQGFQAILKTAIDIVSKNTTSFGLSLDLDGFDPEIAPGVGSPAANGLTSDEVLPWLHLIKDHPKFRAMEITEYNPHLDIQMKTAHLIHKVLREILQRE